jgi:hypothetical protein
VLVTTYDLEGVSNNADSHQLLAVVAAVHHERVGQALDDGALRLTETLRGISTGGVRNVDRCSDLDVITACCQYVVCPAPWCFRSYVREISLISTSS